MLLSLLRPYLPDERALNAGTVAEIEGHLLLLTLPAGQFAAPDHDPPAAVVRSVGPDAARTKALLHERAQARIDLQRRLPYPEAGRLQARIREINRELSGNADQKDRANWLRARSRGQKGELSLDALSAALTSLDWSVEELEDAELVHINGSNKGILEDLCRQVNKKMQYASIYPDYEDATRWALPADAIVGVEVEVVPPPEKGKKLAVAHPHPDVIYTSIEPAPALWGSSPIVWTQHTAVGVRAWVVTAPDGATFHLQRWPRFTALRPGDGFWKWAYAHGLREQALAALPEAEAAIGAPALLLVHPRGYNACSVCFGSHALTNKQRIMDHGYRRPLWGYNVNPCFGRGYPPYPDAPDGTRDYLYNIQVQAGRVYEDAVRLDRADPTLVFSVTVYVLRGGKRVPELDPTRRDMYGPDKVQEDRVGVEDARWEALRRYYLARALSELGSLWRAIPFYRAAVRCWFLGATYRDIVQIPEDQTGRPTDLLGAP